MGGNNHRAFNAIEQEVVHDMDPDEQAQLFGALLDLNWLAYCAAEFDWHEVERAMRVQRDLILRIRDASKN